MKYIEKKRIFPAICLFTLLPAFFFSCLGIGSQIKINQDGSGTIKLEYRISREFEDMGKLDGNEAQLPVPIGKEDVERTVARVSGLHLIAFATRQDGKDNIHSTELSFDSPEALEAFFDSGRQMLKVVFSERKIDVTFYSGGNTDLSFKEMFGTAFEGYDFSFSLTLPSAAQYSWFDENGKTIQNYPGTCSISGMSVNYTAPMGSIAFLDSPITLRIGW